MDTSTLMIGDTVKLVKTKTNLVTISEREFTSERVTSEEVLDVFGVTEDTVQFRKPSRLHLSGWLYFWEDKKDVQYLPLTTHWLELNGFTYEALTDTWFSSDRYDTQIRLCVGHDGNAFWLMCGDMIDIPINYAHELQQAMRKRGLKEYADNLSFSEIFHVGDTLDTPQDYTWYIHKIEGKNVFINPIAKHGDPFECCDSYRYTVSELLDKIKNNGFKLIKHDEDSKG